MDKYIKANLSEKNVKDINAKNDFKVNDMSFRDPKLKKLPENIKKKRIELYMKFNSIFISLMPYISTNNSGDIAQMFQSVKSMILYSIKN